MSSLAQPRAPRVRPRVRRVAIVSFALLLPLAAHALWDYVEIRRLVREVEAILARGEPVTERDVGAAWSGTTDEHKRSSRSYLAAAMLAHDGSRPELQTLREWLYGGVPLPTSIDEIARTLKAVVAADADALRLADAGNAMEFRGFEPGTEYNYRTAGLSAAAAALSARTIQLALAGEGDQAAGAALSSLVFRRVQRHARWFHLMLNPGGHEIPMLLSLSSPSPPALVRLQAALEQQEAERDEARDLAAQRAWALELMWRQYYGKDPTAPSAYSLPTRSIGELALRPWLTHQFVAALRHWSRVVEAAAKPWPDKADALEGAIGGSTAAAPRAGSIAPPNLAALPSLSTFWRAGADAFVVDRCARVAIAIERFRRDHGGSTPAILAALVPAYLPAVPADPLSGQPLRYHRDSAAYTVYSIGFDKKDDGGDLASELRAAIERRSGRRIVKGNDIGVRVLVR